MAISLMNKIAVPTVRSSYVTTQHLSFEFLIKQIEIPNIIDYKLYYIF